MIRFLLGIAVGAIATAAYLQSRKMHAPGGVMGGRVDELSTAANNWVADIEVNAGDGTPRGDRQVQPVT